MRGASESCGEELVVIMRAMEFKMYREKGGCKGKEDGRKGQEMGV